MQAALAAAIISWDARGLPPSSWAQGGKASQRKGLFEFSGMARSTGVRARCGGQGEVGENSSYPLELGKEGGPRAWQVPLLAGLEISK